MQLANAGGNGNTVVQIVGDGNSVVTGHPHLTLTRYVARRQVHQDLDRLSPYTRSTVLVGREAELASLQSYLSGPRAMAARVLVGGGGRGKTRLALELCEHAAATGWDAGFVTRTELRRFFEQQNLSTWGWRSPTLIVIDDAAEHAQLLNNWIGELVDRAQLPPQAMRLLLLERSASTETGWWTTVFASGGWGASGKRALLDPVEPVPINPLVHADDRLALLRQMLTRSGANQAISLQLEENALRDKLMQLSWGGDPLFLMMAALELARVGHAKALTLGRTDLAQALATREADRLNQLASARSLSPELVLHLAACVTLAQGMARKDFERFATGEKLAIARPSGGDAAALADLLQQALPRTNGIAPVLPDLIGEALIVLSLRQDAGTAAVLRCYDSFGQAVVETVIRCTQDFAEQSDAPLVWLDAIMRAIGDDEDALAALDASLPIESIALRDVNLQVAQRLHRLRAARADAPLEARASALSGLAIALAQVGQREPALQAAQEASDLYRELAALRPDVFRPDLATSLNNLATMLSKLGQREPALQAAQEAVDICRELAALRPDVFRPDLAMSLIVLALCTHHSGATANAVQLAHEAIQTLKPEVLCRPDVHKGLLRAIVRDYFQLCNSEGSEPDSALLQALMPHLI